jgi:very-long-chain ceramide synthase
MDPSTIPSWLSTYLVPFAYISYPVETPNNTDSFHNSSYYGTGILDACFIVTWIAVLAILREFVRLVVMEPFARTWLSRRAAREGISTPIILQKSDKGIPTNNMVIDPNESSGQTIGSEKLDLLLRSRRNGEIKPKLGKITKRRVKGMTKDEWRRERSVLRFAEQGWNLVYYSTYWVLGMVRDLLVSGSLVLDLQ